MQSSDYILAPTKVLVRDACPSGLPDNIDRSSYEIMAIGL